MAEYEVKGICRDFGKKKALCDISFALERGDALGIIGKNGSGKTTLINALRGFISVKSGEMIFCGKALSKNYPFGKFGKAINDTIALDENLSGRGSVYFCAELNNKSKEEADKIIEKCQMNEFADSKISSYSLGMKKRVMIACALISSPEVLLLDEATSALDAEFIPLFRRILLEMRESGKMIIMCDHSLYEMQKICNKISFLENGALTEPVSISEITENGNISLEDAFLKRIGKADEK